MKTKLLILSMILQLAICFAICLSESVPEPKFTQKKQILSINDGDVWVDNFDSAYYFNNCLHLTHKK